jgi:hypothetical protein
MPRATMALAVVLVIGSWAMAGCGDSANPYALPTYDADSTGQPQPRPTASRPADRSARVSRAATPPAGVKYVPADALGEGAWVERGKVAVHTAAQRAAVKAMSKYIAVRVQLANTWQVDEQALATVASGAAVTSARAQAQSQRQHDQRTIGRFIINVSSVKVRGSEATVTGCPFDATSEVDHEGDVVVAPPGGVLITMHLQRSGGTWRAIDWPTKRVPLCDWRK